MLESVKLLLSKSDVEDENLDKLLRTLIRLCEDEAYIYCNMPEYDDVLDYVVIQMVIERFNRIGSEGATAQSFSGSSTTYDSFYSEKVRKMLNKHRRIKSV